MPAAATHPKLPSMGRYARLHELVGKLSSGRQRFALLLIMLVRAAGSFSGESARHTLDSLFTTRSTLEIVAGKALASCRCSCCWSFLLVVAAGYGTRALIYACCRRCCRGRNLCGLFITLGLRLSVICRTTTRATLAGVCGHCNVAGPGISVAREPWHLNEEIAFKQLPHVRPLLPVFAARTFALPAAARAEFPVGAVSG